MEKNNYPRYQPYQGGSRPYHQGRSVPERTTTDDLRVLIEDPARDQEVSARATARELFGIRSYLDDLEVWRQGISSKVAELCRRQAAAMTVIEISDDSSDEGDKKVQREPSSVEVEKGIARNESSTG